MFLYSFTVVTHGHYVIHTTINMGHTAHTTINIGHIASHEEREESLKNFEDTFLLTTLVISSNVQLCLIVPYTRGYGGPFADG